MGIVSSNYTSTVSYIPGAVPADRISETQAKASNVYLQSGDYISIDKLDNSQAVLNKERNRSSALQTQKSVLTSLNSDNPLNQFKELEKS